MLPILFRVSPSFLTFNVFSKVKFDIRIFNAHIMFFNDLSNKKYKS